MNEDEMHAHDEADADYDLEAELAAASQKLRTVLTNAGFAHREGPGTREISFVGRYREWLVHARLDADWFHAYTLVCTLPAELGLRADLLLWVTQANAKMALLKYSVTNRNVLVFEYYLRSPLLTVDDVRSSVSFLENTAERDYRALLRVASGQARLATLADQFSSNATADDAAPDAPFPE